MSRITDFRAGVTKHGGVMRQYRWRFNFSFPASVASSDETKDVSVMAITSTTPKSVLGELMIPFGGREMPLPGDRKFEPISVTFIGVEDDFHHTIFERWSEAFNGTESNTAVAALEDLYKDIEIELLDKNDNVIKTYKLEDAWPQEVGELTLDQTSQDSYSQFTVVLRFFQSKSGAAR